MVEQLRAGSGALIKEFVAFSNIFFWDYGKLNQSGWGVRGTAITDELDQFYSNLASLYLRLLGLPLDHPIGTVPELHSALISGFMNFPKRMSFRLSTRICLLTLLECEHYTATDNFQEMKPVLETLLEAVRKNLASEQQCVLYISNVHAH